MPKVVSININENGGVPKYPVDKAFIGKNKISGDKQKDAIHHGGVDRAVCLFSMDLIGIASSQLRKCNVNKIYLSNVCTFKNRDIFYSYRDSYDQRRFGTFVWIEDKKKGDK